METQTIVLILIGVVILSIIVKTCRNIILTLMPLIALIVSLVKAILDFAWKVIRGVSIWIYKAIQYIYIKCQHHVENNRETEVIG